MSFIMKKAVRASKKLRIGLSGPSNFGKTYSALLLAYGICGDWTKIAVIDTERDSASLYSDLGDYNVIPFLPPFRPSRYIEAITYAESEGMEVIIIDSTSHEWAGTGGCLEWVTELTARGSGNSFKEWGIVTPEHNKFIDKILNSSCHVITTTRKKQTHAMVTGDNGKVKVQKLGLEDVQRDGWEYELDLNFTFQNALHYVVATKDRTRLFKNQEEFVITEDTGRMLKEWSQQGRSLIDDALNQIRRVDSIEQLKAIYTAYSSLKDNEDFLAAFRNRRDTIVELEKKGVKFETGLEEKPEIPVVVENIENSNIDLDTQIDSSPNEDLSVPIVENTEVRPL